jgi:hypothetical protein
VSMVRGVRDCVGWLPACLASSPPPSSSAQKRAELEEAQRLARERAESQAAERAARRRRETEQKNAAVAAAAVRHEEQLAAREAELRQQGEEHAAKRKAAGEQAAKKLELTIKRRHERFVHKVKESELLLAEKQEELRRRAAMQGEEAKAKVLAKERAAERHARAQQFKRLELGVQQDIKAKAFEERRQCDHLRRLPRGPACPQQHSGVMSTGIVLLAD